MMREQNSFVIPGRVEDANPESLLQNQSRDSGSGALRRPGMTG
jgi:hypothetical protein